IVRTGPFRLLSRSVQDRRVWTDRRLRQNPAIQVLSLAVLILRDRHVVARSHTLDPEGLLVRLTTSSQRRDVRARLDEIPTTAEATTAATAARGRLHSDQVPDLLLIQIRRTTTTTRERGGNSLRRRVGRHLRGTTSSARRTSTSTTTTATSS